MSHAMKTQAFENSQKSVFGRTLEPHMIMKDSKSRLIPMCSKFSDLRALQNRRHFGSTMFRTICAKQRFLQTTRKYNSIF
jgi:hypothetical protein